jgi:hypothetical protein
MACASRHISYHDMRPSSVDAHGVDNLFSFRANHKSVTIKSQRDTQLTALEMSSTNDQTKIYESKQTTPNLE